VGDGLAEQPPGLLEVGSAEDRADRRPNQLLQVLGAVAKRVAEEVELERNNVSFSVFGS
jgi:hypothetical protein